MSKDVVVGCVSWPLNQTVEDVNIAESITSILSKCRESFHLYDVRSDHYREKGVLVTSSPVSKNEASKLFAENLASRYGTDELLQLDSDSKSGS